MYPISKQDRLLESAFPNPPIHKKKTETEMGDLTCSKLYKE